MEERKKLTIPDLLDMVARGEKIAFLTAYDYPAALLEDRAGVDMILVGDSAAMCMLGHRTTLPAKMDFMVEITAAVSRAVTRAFVVGDMPYMSYQPSNEIAIKNAGRFIAEGGADAVKLEGGARMAETGGGHRQGRDPRDGAHWPHPRRRQASSAALKPKEEVPRRQNNSSRTPKSSRKPGLSPFSLRPFPPG
jgi:hypothetical protein